MTNLGAFFYPAARPAILLLLMLILPCVALVLYAIQDPDFPFDSVDVGILGALLYPGVIGFLAGASVREVQHCRFVWVLPGVRRDAGTGFLIGAVLAASFATGFIWLAHPNNSPAVLMSLAVLSFCLGAVVIDPRSRFRSLLHHGVALLLLSQVNWVGRMGVHRPGVVCVVTLALAGLFVVRLFSATTYREAPFRLQAPPLPGAYSLQDAARLERQRDARRRPVHRTAGAGASRTGLGGWVRAALLETFGGRPLRSLTGDLRAIWPLPLLIALDAAADRGQLSFADALVKSLYSSIMRSPFVPEFGEKPPYVIVSLVIAAMGGALTFMRQAPLRHRVLYPLSRRDLTRVVYMAGAVEWLCVFASIGGLFLLLGLVAGWAAGYGLRLDFVPHFFRSVVATMALLPLVQWARLRTQIRGASRSPEAVVVLILGIGVMVTVVSTWSFVSPALLPGAGLEMAASLVLLVVSQLLFRQWIRRFYAREDLA